MGHPFFVEWDGEGGPPAADGCASSGRSGRCRARRDDIMVFVRFLRPCRRQVFVHRSPR
jgi:hypothetical protein